MHVLVIEDKRDAASGLSGYLESKGHVVDAVNSGMLTRHLWMVMQYHVIILDVMSPGIDGLGLCRKLRGDGGTAPPILMLGTIFYVVEPHSLNRSN